MMTLWELLVIAALSRTVMDEWLAFIRVKRFTDKWYKMGGSEGKHTKYVKAKPNDGVYEVIRKDH